MTSFDWSVLTAGLAAGFGVAFVAMTGFRRRGARRRAQLAHVAPKRPRRRIDVVPIDDPSPDPDGHHRGEVKR